MKKLLLLCLSFLSLVGVHAEPVMPTTSTLTSYSYYTVTFARQPTKCLQDNGVDVNVSQVAPVPATDAQLWRFEPVSATTYCLVSKLGNRISYNGQKYVTAAIGSQFTFVATTNGSYPDKWELARVGGLVMNDQSGTTVTDYYANDGGNPLILTFVETVSHAIVASEYTPYVTNARTLYNNTVVGIEYGQFSTAARAAFNAVIAIEEAKDANVLTSQQMNDGITALQNATTTYIATVNTVAQGTPNKWYTMESSSFPGKFLTLNPATKAVTIQAKDNTANQLFRFVQKPANAEWTNLNEISCKSLQEGSFRCETDNWDVVYNTGLNFSGGSTALTDGYWAWDMRLSVDINGTQTSLMSVDWDFIATDGTNVVNSGEKNAWKIVYDSQDETTLVSAANTSNISVKAIDRMLVVSGTNAKVKAYTVSGVQVDATKPLKQGVYIVKVAGLTAKVLVD